MEKLILHLAGKSGDLIVEKYLLAWYSSLKWKSRIFKRIDLWYCSESMDSSTLPKWPVTLCKIFQKHSSLIKKVNLLIEQCSMGIRSSSNNLGRNVESFDILVYQKRNLTNLRTRLKKIESMSLSGVPMHSGWSVGVGDRGRRESHFKYNPPLKRIGGYLMSRCVCVQSNLKRFIAENFWWKFVKDDLRFDICNV